MASAPEPRVEADRSTVVSPALTQTETGASQTSSTPTDIENSMRALNLTPTISSTTAPTAAPSYPTSGAPEEGTRGLQPTQSYGDGYPLAAYGSAPPAPMYGAQPGPNPTYGNVPPTAPMYGTPPPGVPAYGVPPPAAPGYGSSPAAPAYGSPPPTTPAYGVPPLAAPGYASPPPDTRAYGGAPQAAPGAPTYGQQPPKEQPKKKGFFGKMTANMPHIPQMNTATKVALGVGAGLLVGGAVEHAIDDGDFQMNLPQMPQMPQIPNYGPPLPHHHQQQHHHHQGGGMLGALAGGGLAGGALGGVAGLMGRGRGNNPVTNTNTNTSTTTGGWMGGGMAIGGPKLHILSANYGGGDVTDKARQLITPDQCLNINDEGNKCVFDDKFGDHWGGQTKSLAILYQWQGRPLELALVAQGGGGVRIDHRDHVRPQRRAFITECGPVIAVVWGIMENRFEPVPAHCIQDIASYRSFKADNDYFGFNGWQAERKTAVVFARDGGRIYNVAVREGNQGSL